MVANAHTQSLPSFQETAAATLDRLKRTGEPEVLTIDGQPRTVLLSLEAFDDLSSLARRAADEQYMAEMALAIQDARAGKGQEVREAFAEMRKTRLSSANTTR